MTTSQTIQRHTLSHNPPTVNSQRSSQPPPTSSSSEPAPRAAAAFSEPQEEKTIARQMSAQQTHKQLESQDLKEPVNEPVQSEHFKVGYQSKKVIQQLNEIDVRCN